MWPPVPSSPIARGGSCWSNRTTDRTGSSPAAWPTTASPRGRVRPRAARGTRPGGVHRAAARGGLGTCACRNHIHARQAGFASLRKRLQGTLARGHTSPTHDCSMVARPCSAAVRVEAWSRHIAVTRKGQTAHNGDGQEHMVARWLLACTRYSTASIITSRHDGGENSVHSDRKCHSATLSDIEGTDS